MRAFGSEQGRGEGTRTARFLDRTESMRAIYSHTSLYGETERVSVFVAFTCCCFFVSHHLCRVWYGTFT